MIAVLLVSAGALVFATEPLCSLSPAEFWLDGNKSTWLTGNNLNLSCQVPFGTENVWANITYPSGPVDVESIALENATPTEYYVYISLNNMLPPGGYTVTIYFDNETNNCTNSFNIRKLTSTVFPLLNPEIYTDEVLSIRHDFRIDGNEITSPSKTDFEIYLDDALVPLQSSYPALEYWDLTADIQGIASGDYDITVYSTYNNEHTVSTTCYDCLKIKPLLVVDIVEPPLFTPYELSDTQDLEITVKVMHKSDALTDEDAPTFRAELDGQELFIKRVTYSQGVWKLLVNIPKSIPKGIPYNLDIVATYNGISEKSSKPLPIRFVLLFEGTLKNAENTLIKDAEIRLTGTLSEKINTSDSGSYSVNIIPGTYDIELVLPEVRAKFYGVNLSDSVTEPIKCDYFGEEKAMDKINAVKVAVLESSLSFNKVDFEIKYDDLKVNEEQMVIYKCESWSFGQRSCFGIWEQIEAAIDTGANTVSFDASELSAFAISELNPLRLAAELDKDEYSAGETAVLRGSVFDGKNNTVSGVEVTYNMSDFDISGSVITDSDGKFNVELNSPKQDGTFTIELKAEKQLYAYDTLSINQKVIMNKELSISTISSLNTEPSSSKSVLVSVRNTGQSVLEDIYIYVSGAPVRWYSVNPLMITQLNPNEKEDVELIISVPEDAESQEYTVEIEAKSYDVSKRTTFTLNVLGVEPEQEVELVSKDSSFLSSTKSRITGFVGAVKTTVSDLYLFALLAAVAFLATKKKNRGTKFSRDSVMKELNEIKSETLKTVFRVEPQSAGDTKKSDGNDVIQERPEKKIAGKSIEDVVKDPFSS